MPTPNQLRSSLYGIAVIANRRLDTLWRQVDTAELAREALKDTLPALIEVYGSAAAALAADWYDDRRAEAAVSGSFTAIPAEITDTGGVELAGWGVGPLFQAEPDWAAARAQIFGGLQRRVTNAGRSTVMESSVADPRAAGWRRIGAGGCGFCQMLIGRGAVYRETTADFKSHDHCRCAAVPEFIQ